MKTTIVDEDTKPQRKYPYVGRSKVTGTVALFNAPCSGIVICAGRRPSVHVVGEVVSIFCEKNFEPWSGTIKFENQVTGMKTTIVDEGALLGAGGGNDKARRNDASR